MLDRTRVSPPYWPLYDYLVTQPAEQVVLRLSEVEAVIGVPLPPRAHGRQWWVQAHASRPGRAWLEAGWRAKLGTVWGREPVVTFVRDGDGMTPGLP